jgi:hypoxanthine phosphoribosyltransferase
MKLKNLTFKKYIRQTEIKDRVKKVAATINVDYHNKTPLLLPVLNGSFMFASDLMKNLTIDCRVSFVKHASYEGVSSTPIKTLIGLQESVFGLDVLVVEDIMDTGETLTRVVEELKNLGAKSVEIVVLLRKAKAKQHAIKPKYIAFDIADPFVVGYGLDYDGLGRNLADVYQKAD